MSTKSNHIQSVDKAFAILDYLMNQEMSLSELSEATGYPKSTIHAFLATMLDLAVIDQNESDGRYRLGRRLFEYGAYVSRSWNIVVLSKAYLRELMAATGESIFLAQLIDEALLVVDSAEPSSVYHASTNIAEPMPSNCTSQGKAILANIDEEKARQLLKRTGMPLYTTRTIMDEEKLFDQLAKIREKGYAVEYEEYFPGLCSVAAPVFDKNGECRYAVSIVSLTHRVDNKFKKQSIQRLLDTARAITTNLACYRQ